MSNFISKMFGAILPERGNIFPYRMDFQQPEASSAANAAISTAHQTSDSLNESPADRAKRAVTAARTAVEKDIQDVKEQIAKLDKAESSPWQAANRADATANAKVLQEKAALRLQLATKLAQLEDSPYLVDDPAKLAQRVGDNHGFVVEGLAVPRLAAGYIAISTKSIAVDGSIAGIGRFFELVGGLTGQTDFSQGAKRFSDSINQDTAKMWTKILETNHAPDIRAAEAAWALSLYSPEDREKVLLSLEPQPREVLNRFINDAIGVQNNDPELLTRKKNLDYVRAERKKGNYVW